MANADNSLLLLIDVQGKLAQLMHEREALFNQMQILLQGCQAIGLPVLWAEQVPHKLGPTIPALAQHLPEQKPIAKQTFSCLREGEFERTLKASKRRQLIVMGIETHICVMQTCLDALAEGYEVYIVADAVGSRSVDNKTQAIERLRQAGATITTTESILFELMIDAEHPAFRTIQKLIA